MAQINYGDIKGITVHDTPDNAVVEISRFEQKTAAQFKGKVQGGFYSSYLNDKSVEAQPGNTLLAVSKNVLRSDAQIQDFNHRVSQASAIHNKLQADFEKIHDTVKFDLGGEKGVVPRYGQDPDKKDSTKKQNWAYGTVVGLNDSYVAVSAGSSDNANFVRILPLEKFISSKEESDAYSKYFDEKLANNDSKVENPLTSKLTVGDYKKLTWKAEDGKPSTITAVTAEKKEKKVEEKAEEKQETRKQAVKEVAAENNNVEEATKAVKKTRKKAQEMAA